MSRLNELIQKLCPDGVEFKKLSMLCDLSRGKVYSKTYIAENPGIYPVYSSQTENNGELGRISTYDYDGEYLTWTTDGAYAGTIFHRKGKFSITNVCGLISIKSPNILIRFLYYWLSIKAKDYVYRGMGNPKLMSNQIAPVKIPIPPLDIQNEIVRILDTFTSHAAELQAELQARKEQYEYYRNKLLTFDKDDKNVKWMKLGDVCTLNRGIRVVRNDLNKNGKYPVYQNSLTPLGYYDKSNYPKNTTFIISAGAAGEIGFSKEPMWAADDCLCIICTDDLVSKYVYHYLIEHKIFLISKIRKASIPRLSRVTIEQLPIAIPNISEQQRIVSILDKFEALVNDLTDGLPAEIAAVQEQYEYYRNKLLTFK